MIGINGNSDHKRIYSVSGFKWDSENRAFIADSRYGLSMPVLGVHPIGKKEFFLYNPITNGFRRFRFIKQVVNESIAYNQFITEDNILAIIPEYKREAEILNCDISFLSRVEEVPRYKKIINALIRSLYK